LGSENLLEIIEHGQAQSIALEDIEKGITALWQAADKSSRLSETETAVMRACVMNLIICTHTDREMEIATKAIARLTWSYPSRSIVLLTKPEEPDDEVISWISAHCQMPDPKGSKVCCEQITIEGHGSAADRINSMVLPLLVSDLPVVLWWMEDLRMDNTLFEYLLYTVDRLVVDSRAFRDPATSFRELTKMAETNQYNTRFSDLNWARLTPWRSAIAQLFDAPNCTAYLDYLEKIEIEYEAPYDEDHPNFSEAMLLVGWLAKTLDWKPAFSMKVRGSNASLILNKNGEPLKVDFHGHNERKDDVGGITSVRLFASNPKLNSEATFTVSLGDDYEHAVSKVEENEVTIMAFNSILPLREATELMHEELSIVGRDAQYEGALQVAGQFAV
jgi:glucose-6-phosphate dehydrogenase assembly protein OpcA